MKETTSSAEQANPIRTDSASASCLTIEDFFASSGITTEEDKDVFLAYIRELFSVAYDCVNNE